MLGDPFEPPRRKRRLTAADKKRIAAKQNWKCKECKKLLRARFHVDHIKEFSEGGSDIESNLQALCPNCHAEKIEKDRHNRKQKKIKEQEKRESEELIGGGNVFKLAPGKGKRKELNWNQYLAFAQILKEEKENPSPCLIYS